MKAALPPEAITISEGGESGVTALVIITTSLLSLHTFPEDAFIYIDLFSCKTFSEYKCVDLAKTFFGIIAPSPITLQRGFQHRLARL